MKTTAPKPQRCAIYTRKSTEHNLDLAFNSLDAQREACEAYIKSQAHEGWRLVPGRFDDGGLSGASLERPALQSLLNQIRDRRIDIVVVYKVDRLTRSLADFAKLVELFDANEVSFVSVTQSFNTTSSMGRLTLNVLLSFAQFEREVIGERVRDKIAASKRKGIWVGGPIALGYASRAKKLVIVPEDAALVRKIFEDYLRLGSIGEVVAALGNEGIRPNPRPRLNGTIVQAERFLVGPIAHILKNRFYIGEVVYRGETNMGEHDPIVDREVFEAVQQRLAASAVSRKHKNTRSSSYLVGLLFDDRGHAMSPSHANKKGIRYRYYVSQAVLQNRKSEAGSVARVSAPEVERIVTQALRDAFQGGEESSDVELIARHLRRVTIHSSKVTVVLLDESVEDGISATTTAGGPRVLELPFTPTLPIRKGIARTPAPNGTIDPRERDALLLAIARARDWMDAIISGRSSSFEEIASKEGLGVRHVRRLAPLAFLSPRVAQAIAEGSASSALTVSFLTPALPHSWLAQEEMVGLR